MIFNELRFLKRLSLWLLVPVLALSAILFSAAFWLCATEAGTRWLTDRLTTENIQVEQVTGTLKDGLTINGLSVATGGSRIEVAHIEGQWQLYSLLGGEFVIDHVNARQISVSLSSDTKPTEPASWPALHLPIPIAINQLTLSDIRIQQPDNAIVVDQVQLQALITPLQTRLYRLAVHSPLGQISLEGKLFTRYPYKHALNADWQWGEHYQGQLHSEGSLKNLTVSHQLNAPYALSTTGEIRLKPSSTITTKLDDIDVSLITEWQDAIAFFGAEQPAMAEGSVLLEGNLAQYLTRASAQLIVPQAAPDYLTALNQAHLSTEAQGNLDGANLSELVVTTGHGNVSATGDIHWREGFSWQGKLQVEDLATQGLIPSVDAVIACQIETDGQYANGSLSSQLSLIDLTGMTHGHVIEGRGNVGIIWQKQLELNIADFALTAGPNQLTLDGQAGLQQNINWNLSAPDISVFNPLFAGSISSKGNLKGAWPSIIIDGAATGKEMVFDTWSASALNLDFSGTTDDQSDIRLVLKNLMGPGLASTQLEVKATGSPLQHQVEGIVDQQARHADVMFSGSYQNKQWQGNVPHLLFNDDFAGQWTLAKTTHISAAPQSVSVAPFCLTQADSEVCGKATYRQQLLSASLHLDKFGLAFFRQWLPPETTLDGTVSVEAAVEGKLSALTGQYALTTEDGQLALVISRDNTIRQAIRLQSNGTWKQGKLATLSELFLTETGQLTMAANIDPVQGALSGSITGEISSLAWLQTLTSQLENIEGQIQADIALSGTLKEPKPKGFLHLRQFSATFPALGTTLEPSDLEVTLGQDEWHTDATLVSSGKTLLIEGSGKLTDIESAPLELRLTGEDFPLLNLPDYSASVSPDLTVSYAKQIMKVGGTLAVPKADFVLQPRPDDIIEVTSDEVITPAVATNGSLLKVQTDITLQLDRKVHFEGYGLTTRLEGDLKLKRKSRGVPSARGIIALKGGKYEAYGQKLEVDRGLLLFQGPLDNPGLNIIAQRRTSQALVGVEIGGTADNIKSRLFSDPTLPPTHTLSLLTTGKLPGNYSETESNQMANAAAALGISQSEWLTGQLQQELGVDVFTLQSGETYEESSLVVGKYLSPKLFVSYIQNLFSPEGALAFEYHIGDRLGLKAQSGDAQSLDLLYRIEHE